MKQKLGLTLLTYLSYCIDEELYKAIDYLREQVRVLVEQHEATISLDIPNIACVSHMCPQARLQKLHEEFSASAPIANTSRAVNKA